MATNEAQVSGTTHSGSSMRTTSTGGETSSSTQEVLITGIQSIDTLNLKYGVTSAEKLLEDDSIPEFSNVYKFTIADDVITAVEEYSNDSSVEFAEPNYLYQLLSIPNDPLFGMQWALQNTGQTGGAYDADIDATDAWNVTMGDDDVVIAIIDTGVDSNHPDLANNIISTDSEDWFGHGTHCAGIAAAVTNNGIGVAGVAGSCKIISRKAFTQVFLVTLLLQNFIIARDIINVTKNGADVISMSFGGPILSRLQGIALNYADNQGVVLIAAAGNSDACTPFYPAAHDKVIAVAANDSRAFFSQFGGWIDVAAPGVDILSLRANGTDMHGDGTHIVDENYYICSGTSMACPHVAGVAALVLSKNPDLTPQEVRTILRSSTDPANSDEYIGTGRINAYKAVQKAAHVTAELDPSLGDKNVQGAVKIGGVAKGESFQQYKIECGKGLYPTSWTQIMSSNLPNFGILPLAELDTIQLDEGLYTIRLTVTASGFTYEDMTVVRVDNVANTHYVDDVANNGGGSESNPFNKIQYAIDICGSKDTVFVYNGVYHEHLSIGAGRSVNLIGENKETTVVDSTGIWWSNSAVSTSSSLRINGFKLIPPSSIDISIAAIGVSNCEIYGNKIIGGGISIIGFCPLAGSWSVSLDNIISGNKFTGNAFIDLIGCRQNTISDNIMTNGHIGLLWSKNNDIKNNSGGGLELTVASFNNICDNKISNSNSGINLSGLFRPSAFNLISRNTITNSNYGICLGDNCKFNTISENNISNNVFGIHIDSSDMEYNSDYNEIFQNNLISNNLNAYDGCNNTWYKPLSLQGNFWSDYKIKYPNANPRPLMPWIWDTPYAIPGGNNQDKYPLVNAYSSSQSTPQSNPQSNPTPQSQPGSTQQTKTGSTTNK
jgi:thermitase